MNLNRVKAIVSKDFYWAKNNAKLLGITLMPALMNVFFAKTAGAAIFTISLSFSISMIGIFLTSFLLIEEKRKGTLKALLTTPLTNAELLTGKFIFTFSICMLIATFSLAINSRIDLLYSPVSMLNIAIFSATTCFIGFSQGLFFKNEQEMGVAAPIILLLFTVGPAIEEATESDVAAFFPDYHFTHALDAKEISNFEAAFHTSYGLLIAIAAFVFATAFARFYFSNNNEKRFSAPLAVILLGFLCTFGVSGVISPKLINGSEEARKESLSKLALESMAWKGHIAYDPSKIKVKKVVSTKDLKSFKLITKDGSEIGVQIRSTKPSESTEEAREKKVRSKKAAIMLAKEDLIYSSLKFKKWVYVQNQTKLSILTESYCNNQLFQIFFGLEVKESEKIGKLSLLLNQILENSSLECKNIQTK